jgi:hypothetical protein
MLAILAWAVFGQPGTNSLKISATLRDARGQTLQSGTYRVQIKLYDQGSGEMVFERSQRITVGSGSLHVNLTPPKDVLARPLSAALCLFDPISHGSPVLPSLGAVIPICQREAVILSNCGALCVLWRPLVVGAAAFAAYFMWQYRRKKSGGANGAN